MFIRSKLGSFSLFSRISDENGLKGCQLTVHHLGGTVDAVVRLYFLTMLLACAVVFGLTLGYLMLGISFDLAGL